MKYTAFFILLISGSIHAMDFFRPSSPQPHNYRISTNSISGYRAGCLEVYDIRESHPAPKQPAHPASPRQATNNIPAQKALLPRVASLAALLQAARVE